MAERRAIGVGSQSGDYDVLIGPGLRHGIAARLSALGLDGRVALVTDENVAGHWLPDVRAGLGPHAVHVLPPGEGTKTLAGAQRLYSWLASEHFGRSDVLLALGGGVVGDLAGFAAATYHRGMRLVHAPTTLLAQVDSSIGGKVAVDLPEGKNLVGAIYPPKLVLADTETLSTLPERERWNGLAEVAKAALISDGTLLAKLEPRLGALGRGSLSEAELAELVSEAAALKAQVVTADEREGGLRMVLNFGHTIGHALEAATGMGPLLHGEAVVLGMGAELQLSAMFANLPRDDEQRAMSLLRQFPALPTFAADTAVGLAALKHDKKGSRVALLERLGRAVISHEVPGWALEQMVRRLCAQLSGGAA